MIRHLRLLGSLSLFAVLLAACAPAASGPSPGAQPAAKPAGKPAAGPEPFAGKTITLVVPNSAGGPTDIFARMVAQLLDRHVPGRPSVVVENKPGAGGIVGMNHVYNVARKDGLTIGVFSGIFGHQTVGAEGVQYDAAKFLWLGAADESAVGFVHPGLGVRAPRDLLQAGEIVAGGLSPDSTKDMSIRSFLNVLGARYKYVTGYPGSADARLAYMRGEINYFEDSLTSWFANYVPLLKDGGVVPLGQRGLIRGGEIVRDARVGDVPTYAEIAVELRGESVKQTADYRAMRTVVQMVSLLLSIVYPPETSPDLVATMRRSLADTFADPEFQAAAEKQVGFQVEFVPGVQAQELAERIVRETSSDAEALEYLRRLARERG
jgi:tripartite-type tricarboxylate transporter receptor subunit TctC